MQTLPVSANMNALNGVKLGIVIDPRLLRDYPQDISRTLWRKVIQASSFAQKLGTRAFFVIQNEESAPAARYIDAMGGTVVSDRPEEYVSLVVPHEQLSDVDSILLFTSPNLEFEYEAPNDEIEMTPVKVRLSPGALPTMREKPYTADTTPKMKPQKDPYRNFHVPDDFFVQKVPDTYRQEMMEAKPDFPQNYTITGNG